jgi:tetratricopeptide (TPR) repeat protein
MKRTLIVIFGLLSLALSAWAQADVAKQPQPKSQKEVDALQKVFQAQTPETRLTAAEEVITGFKDTEFRGVMMQIIVESLQQMNDYDRLLVYGERALAEDPKNYEVQWRLAQAIAQKTGEHDLDREQKLSTAEKYANAARENVGSALKPNPQVTDEQWEGYKKELLSQIHSSLGLVAMNRKKYDVAVTELKTAIDVSAQPDPRFLIWLGESHRNAGQYDEAVAALDKVIADTSLPPAFKQVAENAKKQALEAKAKAGK